MISTLLLLTMLAQAKSQVPTVQPKNSSTPKVHSPYVMAGKARVYGPRSPWVPGPSSRLILPKASTLPKEQEKKPK